MIEVGSLGATLNAATLIGAVLLEAIVLYGAYGVVEQLLGHRIVDRLRAA